MSKKFKYIDIHGHVNFSDYDKDREATIVRAHNAGVAMITVGTDIKTSTSALQLATAHEHMWATVGVHPTEASKSQENRDWRLVIRKSQNVESISLEERKDGEIGVDFEALEKLAEHPKVVAIGECGLDYFHSKPEDIAIQKQVFEKHIQLAQKVNKPLMLHVRNGKFAGSTSSVGNAYGDALDILKKYPSVRANFHFFAGSLIDLKNIIEKGYMVSFTGVISFTSDYDELIRTAPISQIMSETDCPFVSPAPYRGKRNEPSYVIETVKAIARIRVEDEGVVSQQLVENAKNFFRL